jgi:pilus assembly protein CpaC
MGSASRHTLKAVRTWTMLAVATCTALGLAPMARGQSTRPINLVRTTAPSAAKTASSEPILHASPKAGQIVEVTVGESRTLDAAWPVKVVSVADPAIADVDAISPSRIQIRGKALGITELALESETGETWRARLVVSADTTRLQTQLRQLFSNSDLDVAQVDDVIVVKGTLARTEDAAQMRQLLKLAKVDYLDLTRVAGLQQVQLQVKVAEVSRTAIRMLGVNAFYGGNEFFGGVQLGSSAGPFIPMNVGLPSGVPVSGGPLPFQTNSSGVLAQPSATLFAGFPNSDLQVFLQALEENQYLRIMAEPTLVARSGQTAHFLAGGEFPLPVSQLNGGETQISIEYKEFGIRLEFTPTVLGDGRIELHVRPEVSELSDVGAVEVLGTRIPSLLTRRVETTLDLQSGQTFAIAGLIDQNDSARVSKVPGFGDLPILGTLFRSTRYSRNDTEMLVLVTASLVEPTSNDLNPPVPGSFHKEPDAWELYIEGRTEGKTSVKLAPAQKERLKRLGLDGLKGPGAWASYDDQPGTLASESEASK